MFANQADSSQSGSAQENMRDGHSGREPPTLLFSNSKSDQEGENMFVFQTLAQKQAQATARAQGGQVPEVLFSTIDVREALDAERESVRFVTTRHVRAIIFGIDSPDGKLSGACIKAASLLEAKRPDLFTSDIKDELDAARNRKAVMEIMTPAALKERLVLEAGKRHANLDISEKQAKDLFAEFGAIATPEGKAAYVVKTAKKLADDAAQAAKVATKVNSQTKLEQRVAAVNDAISLKICIIQVARKNGQRVSITDEQAEDYFRIFEGLATLAEKVKFVREGYLQVSVRNGAQNDGPPGAEHTQQLGEFNAWQDARDRKRVASMGAAFNADFKKQRAALAVEWDLARARIYNCLEGLEQQGFFPATKQGSQFKSHAYAFIDAVFSSRELYHGLEPDLERLLVSAEDPTWKKKPLGERIKDFQVWTNYHKVLLGKEAPLQSLPGANIFIGGKNKHPASASVSSHQPKAAQSKTAPVSNLSQPAQDFMNTLAKEGVFTGHDALKRHVEEFLGKGNNGTPEKLDMLNVSLRGKTPEEKRGFLSGRTGYKPQTP